MNNNFDLNKLLLIYNIKYYKQFSLKDFDLKLYKDNLLLFLLFILQIPFNEQTFITTKNYINNIMDQYFEINQLYNDSEKEWIKFYLLCYIKSINKYENLIIDYQKLPSLITNDKLILQICFRIKAEIASSYIKTNQRIPEDLMNDIRNYPKDNLIPGI